MSKVLSIGAMLAGALICAIPARAEQMVVPGYSAAGSDAAAALRSIAVENFAGQDGPQLSLLVADALRDVRIDGQLWLSVPAGRFGRDAEAALTGTVRTRFDENVVSLRRNVCVAYDAYDNCQQEQEQPVDCLRVTASVRPDLRLSRRSGQALWSWSQESSRNAEYCPDYDEQPDFDAEIEEMLGEFARAIRYQLAPAQEGRQVRVLGGRDDLPRPLRDTYRNALRQTERDPAAACVLFAQLAPQAPQHPQLLHNTALCAEREGRLDEASAAYTRLQAMRGARSEAQAGLNRIAQNRRAQQQIARRGR